VCLVDYKGYRLLAISLLPISEKTIIYGSSNGVLRFFPAFSWFNTHTKKKKQGRTIHAEEAESVAMMREIGAKLNLREHLVGMPDDVPKTIVGPTGLILSVFFLLYFTQRFLFVVVLFVAVPQTLKSTKQKMDDTLFVTLRASFLLKFRKLHCRKKAVFCFISCGQNWFF
jgi:hypothetical protein